MTVSFTLRCAVILIWLQNDCGVLRVRVCMQVILHPKWGGNVYPASLFAKAPADKLQAAIDAVNNSPENAR